MTRRSLFNLLVVAPVASMATDAWPRRPLPAPPTYGGGIMGLIDTQRTGGALTLADMDAFIRDAFKYSPRRRRLVRCGTGYVIF